jgi:hypothetical protein
MSSHDHDNHSSEPKEVAFRTPLIMGLVTILIILLAVSTCDKKHGCCEDDKEKCEAACESKHGEQEAHGEHHAATMHEAAPVEEHAVVADTLAMADTTSVAPAVEEHAHH